MHRHRHHLTLACLPNIDQDSTWYICCEVSAIKVVEANDSITSNPVSALMISMNMATTWNTPSMSLTPDEIAQRNFILLGILSLKKYSYPSLS